ncbi:MAG: Type 1 glutamine amidotransferase-like domain-containing protein [Chloroflexi bacterium]|nr:Type 1 glutamine amidotransferase-like domain-containing protein [Ktedonobacteraceae bacterium]MBV8821966.1 Type 1 glutamine amidotransferase-like domain-containing protein [Ktedonobacteraceae bacterium]MBV9021839.1 Type 1 glutamine amidotransferase-like domain-containing protein [Ktedonobacteraceae bacterium]MBV9707989.1 Type 1 glutamine amidotransferase-like domain-containing protein [Chloroflexota bacterium]
MAAHILLEGGAEFGGQMAHADRRALELAGGVDASISIIPTAAAPDNNDKRAGNNGVRWFQSLGAHNVEALPLIDKTAANDSAIAHKLRQSHLIYLLGGFTGYLNETLKGSTSWQAMLAAYASGAVIAGSSAGAMVLCQYYYDPGKRQMAEGLGLVSNTCVLPHHNTFGKDWAQRLGYDKLGSYAHIVLLGIDEYTGMLDDAEGGKKIGWRVYGQGAVTLYHAGKAMVYTTGQTFKLL